MGRLVWLAVALFGCSGPAMAPDLHEGGSIAISQCGYEVTTQYGASRPALGTPQVGSDPTRKQVHLTLPGDPARSMAILWRTNDEQTLATTVQYGVGTATDQSQLGITYVYDLDMGGTVRIHETHLCGLMPDTQYSYRVGGDGAANGWSPVYTFRTAPDRALQPDATLEALVIGDTRGGYSTWGQTVAIAFQTATPDVIWFSGDATTIGLAQDEWDSWFDAVATYLHSTPMVFAHGNHEVNAVNFYSLFAFPGDEENFALDLGPVHLTVANDTPADASALTGQYAQLLDSNLKAGVGRAMEPDASSQGHVERGPEPAPDRLDRRARRLATDRRPTSSRSGLSRSRS